MRPRRGRSRDPSRADVLLGLANRMRSKDAQEAASAVLVADDALKEADIPQPIDERDLEIAKRILATGYAYRPGPRMSPDARRLAMHFAADRTESMVRALRWLDRIRRGRFIGGRTYGVQIMRRGRVVARGQDLAAITRYLRKANGATLVALQRVYEPVLTGQFEGPMRGYPSGILHIYFADGATLSTRFASYDIMADYVRQKHWLKGVPVIEVPASR